MKPTYEYEQYLSDKLELLYFKDERYAKLRELIQKDDEVVFAVRKDEIHIYYLGGRILKVTKAYDYLKLTIDLKYAKKKKGSDELNQYGNIIKTLNDTSYKDPLKVTELWNKHWNDLKRCMKTYRDKVTHNDERQLQQVLELANRDFNGEVVVIDNEYGVREIHDRSSKLCKFDLVTIYRDGEKYKICLIELKLGDGAIGEKSGIMEHIGDFDKIIKARRRDVIASINNLIKYKELNKSLYHVPKNFELIEDTEICASVLCYDLRAIEKAQSEIENGVKKSKSGFKLYNNLYLNSNRPLLTKKDILGE